MGQIQVKIDDDIIKRADELLVSLGLDMSTAVKIFINAVLDTNGIPFEIKKRHSPVELDDGFGSYICKYGHIHNYSNLKFDNMEISETFNSVEKLMRSLNDE